MNPSEFAALAAKHTKGLDPQRVAAWGVLFTLLVSGGADVEEAARHARETVDRATPAEIAELASEE